MKWKLKVKEVLESCQSRDGHKFYKVQFHSSWLPSNAIQHMTKLIDDFLLKKDEKFQTGGGELQIEDGETKESDDLKQLDIQVSSQSSTKKCYFCNKPLDVELLDDHEKEHLFMDSHNIESLINQDGLRKENDIMLVSLNLCKNTDNKIPVNKPEKTNVDETKAGDGDTCPNISVADFFDQDIENLPEVICPICNQGFKTFLEFRAHYHTYHFKEQLQNTMECDQCQRHFVSKKLFEKHYELHKASNRRQKSYGKNLTSTKKHALRRALINKIYNVPMAYSNVVFNDYSSNSSHENVNKTEQSSSNLATLKNPYVYNEEFLKQVTMKERLTGMMNQSHGDGEVFDPTKPRPYRQEEEFAPEVLLSARKYIKAVSVRRKQVTQLRQRYGRHHFDGCGVDVELNNSDDAVPIISKVNGKRSYGCKVCSKVFFNKFHHREHYNVHSGEMPYVCEFCSKRFAQRSGWNRHIKLHHKYKFFTGPLPVFRSSKGSQDTNSPSKTLELKEALSVVQTENLPISAHSFIQPSISSAIASIPSSMVESRSLIINAPLTYLPISPAKGLQVPDTDSPSLPPSAQGMGPLKKVTTNDNHQVKQSVFQCKKVRTMGGSLVFMIRVSILSRWKHDSKEFAYILDDAGKVVSRIFVDDYPGGDWLDFPLAESANDVLLHRVRSFDASNKRGPKPHHTNKKTEQVNISYKTLMDAIPLVNDSFSSICSAIQAKSAPSFFGEPPVLQQGTEYQHELPSVTEDNQTKLPQQGRIFRSGKTKRFECDKCGRKFLAQAHLKDHMMIHTGELPYKCIFCARPFRHKSGLNSHHKRHIQKGVFNRPISGGPKGLEKSLENVDTLTQQQMEHIKSIMKPKRKGRKPKHYVKNTENNHAAADNDDDDEEEEILVQIKVEEDDLQLDMTNELSISSYSDKHFDSTPHMETSYPSTVTMKNLQSSSLEQRCRSIFEHDDPSNVFMKSDPNKSDDDGDDDVFKCNFCDLQFIQRTVYLKHVSAVHKGLRHSLDNVLLDTDHLSSSHEPGDGIDDLDTDVLGDNHDMMENLFPEVKIKEELIDDY